MDCSEDDIACLVNPAILDQASEGGATLWNPRLDRGLGGCIYRVLPSQANFRERGRPGVLFPQFQPGIVDLASRT
ncbi:MAG: hypothetical protein CXX73_03040 [Methanobacteriota archaeon]|nr:MAG: hypothetical protein CXX73_03040 [Euryarchaeota archaeon]